MYYNLKNNTWTGPCNKNTRWCFVNKYNTPNYGHLYNKELFKCCNNNLMYLFNKLNIASKQFGFRFFLDCGSLIGCLRNGKRIPWDVDIDVGILMEDFNKLKMAIPFLTKDGEIFTQPTKLMIVYQLSKKNNIHIDIGLYQKVKRNNTNVYITSYSTSIPSCTFIEDDLLPLKTCTFENMEVLIPNNSKKYLEANYGKKCIENPITKHSYIENYVNGPGSKGDLPDTKTWKEMLSKQEK